MESLRQIVLRTFLNILIDFYGKKITESINVLIQNYRGTFIIWLTSKWIVD